MIEERIKNGVLKHYAQGLDLAIICQKMNVKKEVVIEVLVTDLYAKGNSYNDICLQLHLKRHVVEGILNTLPKSIETPIETPTSGFQLPKQTASTVQVASNRERELALELEILKEKNRFIELESRKIETQQITERERLKLQNTLEQRKLELSYKQQNMANLAQLQMTVKIENKKAIVSLQDKINRLIKEHLDNIDDDLEVYYDYATCMKLLKTTKSLLKSYKDLFASVDVEDTLHGKALLELIADFTPVDDEGNSLSYDDLTKLENCLLDGVCLGDVEVEFSE